MKADLPPSCQYLWPTETADVVSVATYRGWLIYFKIAGPGMGFLGFNFDLKQQLAFYGAYHRHPGNKLVHFIFVPLIFWSVMILLNYTPQLSDKLDLPAALSHILPESIAR